MEAVGQNIVNHFTLRTTGAFDDYLHLSTPYSPYGIGVSFLVVPVYALSKLTGHTMALLTVINPLVTATTGVFIYAIGRELRWKSAFGRIGGDLVRFAHYGVMVDHGLFSEPSVGLCVAILVWAVLRWRNGWQRAPMVVGIAGRRRHSISGLFAPHRLDRSRRPPSVRAVADICQRRNMMLLVFPVPQPGIPRVVQRVAIRQCARVLVQRRGFPHPDRSWTRRPAAQPREESVRLQSTGRAGIRRPHVAPFARPTAGVVVPSSDRASGPVLLEMGFLGGGGCLGAAISRAHCVIARHCRCRGAGCR